MRYRSLLSLLLLTTLFLSWRTTQPQPDFTKLQEVSPDVEIIPDEYIIRFHDGYDLRDHLKLLGLCGNTDKAFEPMLSGRGYFGHYDQRTLRKVLSDPGVRFVEKDTMGYIVDLDYYWGVFTTDDYGKKVAWDC